MQHVFQSKEVKIRKPRKCWGCGTFFDIGRLMKCVVCVENGDFSTTYWCEVCDAYLSENGDVFDADEGVAQHEFRGESHYVEFKIAYLCIPRKVITEKTNKPKTNFYGIGRY